MDQELSLFCKKQLLLIALLQGLALLLLHQSMAFHFWPGESPSALIALYVFTVTFPTFLMVAFKPNAMKPLVSYALAYALLTAALGYYFGTRLSPMASGLYQLQWHYFLPTLFVAGFIVLVFIQAKLVNNLKDYRLLCTISWQSAQTLVLSCLFMLLTWGVLMLWAEVFALVDIDFFRDLFSERWFYYPALSLAFGFGILLFSHHSVIGDVFAKIIQLSFKGVLVVVALLVLVFLATLPFTGLEVLFKNAGGSYLLLFMQLLMVFAVNAAYVSSLKPVQYPQPIHRLIAVALLVLPIYSMIIFYGLVLRIEQYGLTPSRAIGFIVALLLFAYVITYAVKVIQERSLWSLAIGRVNIALSGLMVLVLLSVNAPWLNVQKLSVDSQLSRLERGDLTLEKFPYDFFKYHLGRDGYEALMELSASLTDEQDATRLVIERLYQTPAAPSIEQDAHRLISSLKLINTDTLPPFLAQSIIDWLADNPSAFDDFISAPLVAVDLNQDGQLDYILLRPERYGQGGVLFAQQGAGFVSHETRWIAGCCSSQEITAENVKVVQPAWQFLQVGKQLLMVEQPESREVE